MDLVCKMLFLRDVSNNALNFGFVSACANRQELAIIDFKIDPDSFEHDMVVEFNRSNISLSKKFEEHKKYFDRIDQQSKIRMASAIFKAYDEFNMMKKFDEAEEFVRNLLLSNDEQKLLKTSEEKFNRGQKYVEKVKANVQKFQNLFNEKK